MFTRSVAFDDAAHWCAVLDGSHRVHLLDLQSGSPADSRHYLLQSAGAAGMLRYTHRDDVLLYSTTQVDGPQRYGANLWGLYDNSVITRFRGHDARVLSLAVSRTDDVFVTSDVSGGLLFFDWRDRSSVDNIKVELPGSELPNSHACLDPNGHYFAVASSAGDGSVQGREAVVDLYDRRRTKVGMSQLRLGHAAEKVSDVSFSPDGKELLLTAGADVHWLTRSGNDELKRIAQLRTAPAPKGHASHSLGKRASRRTACFSPMHRTVLSVAKSDCHQVQFAGVGRDIATLGTPAQRHPTPVDNVFWCPGTELFVTTCMNAVALWQNTSEAIPDVVALA